MSDEAIILIATLSGLIREIELNFTNTTDTICHDLP